LLVEGGERAALDFQRKDFEIVQQDQVRDPSPTNRAVFALTPRPVILHHADQSPAPPDPRCISIRRRQFIGRRDFRYGSIASSWPSADHFRSTPGTDILRAARHASNVPNSDMTSPIMPPQSGPARTAYPARRKCVCHRGKRPTMFRVGQCRAAIGGADSVRQRSVRM
jgi:hypothetical protein